jgi:hypothetical protein
MIVPKLKGRRAFVLKRCSSNSQVGTSIHLQDAGLAQLLEENAVVVVGQKDLAGVTGSIPGARDDIDQIIRLKREGLNFDLLILPNTDRFTRTGSLHGNSILWDLEGEGIAVYFAAENLWSDDRYHQMLLSMMFDAARQTAVSISRGSTAGNTASFLEGRSPHKPRFAHHRNRQSRSTCADAPRRICQRARCIPNMQRSHSTSATTRRSSSRRRLSPQQPFRIYPPC